MTYVIIKQEGFYQKKVISSREKEKERLQGDHCFLHFSRSDSEHENSDWSELGNVNPRLNTFFRLVEINITPFE